MESCWDSADFAGIFPNHYITFIRIQITLKTLQLLVLLATTLFLSLPLLAVEKVILDTDPSYDPDDMGCIAMLQGMANAGELEILAIMNVFHHEESALAISATSTYYNRPAIPVGDNKSLAKEKAPETNYDWYLANHYPRMLARSADAPDSTDLYREILASAEPRSVTILVVGTLHNLELLLKSQPDKHSPLNGIELVRKSVRLVASMGGNFIDSKGYDRTNWGGSDELCRDDRTWACLVEEQNALSRYVLENCPAPFVASGWENGNGQFNGAEQGDVRTGQGLKKLAEDHIVRVAYERHFASRGGAHKIDRHSNDQCALLYGARGAGDYYHAFVDGQIHMSPTGEIRWEQTEGGVQGYVSKKAADSELAELIEGLMMSPVIKRDTTAPTAPGDLKLLVENHDKVLTWTAATDYTAGNWIAYYNVYGDGALIGRAHGLRYVLEDAQSTAFENFKVCAVNVAGIEGPALRLSR